MRINKCTVHTYHGVVYEILGVVVVLGKQNKIHWSHILLLVLRDVRTSNLRNSSIFYIKIPAPDLYNTVAEDDAADDFLIDENSMDFNQLLNNLREEIQFDESIAMKSAMLLKLLEVSSIQDLFIWDYTPVILLQLFSK